MAHTPARAEINNNHVVTGVVTAHRRGYARTMGQQPRGRRQDLAQQVRRHVVRIIFKRGTSHERHASSQHCHLLWSWCQARRRWGSFATISTTTTMLQGRLMLRFVHRFVVDLHTIRQQTQYIWVTTFYERDIMMLILIVQYPFWHSLTPI